MDAIVDTRDTAPLLRLTPQKWAAARAILCGEDTTRVSMAAAARAAGVTVKTFQAWIKRSAERRAEDEPWVYEIAEVAADRDAMQAGRLEDRLWEHANEGVDEPVYQGGEKVGSKTKWDHPMMMKLLGVRDERYKPKPEIVNNNLFADPAELYRKMRAVDRMREIGEGADVS